MSLSQTSGFISTKCAPNTVERFEPHRLAYGCEVDVAIPCPALKSSDGTFFGMGVVKSILWPSPNLL